MEMRRNFAASDLNYLANLCHQCGACYTDCQYSPPHEFAVNVPAALARVRHDSYDDYAWPRVLGALFEHNGLWVAVIAALSVAGFVAGFVWLRDPTVLFGQHAGNFYKLMPHKQMVYLFGGVAIYAVLAMTLSVRAFWRDIRGGAAGGSLAEAIHDATTLRYLGGGGGGCTSESEKPSRLRRIFHHFTFYGFLLCFASTSVATLYHYVFNWKAPYALSSVPVVLGIVGGVGLLIGPLGLVILKRRRMPILTDQAHQRHRFPADAAARHAIHGLAARAASRRGFRPVPHAALWQVRSRPLPLRGADEIRQRAPQRQLRGLAHDPEKWVPVFGKDHAQNLNRRGRLHFDQEFFFHQPIDHQQGVGRIGAVGEHLREFAQPVLHEFRDVL
jgi:citrate/tricarballylate utilization protein